MEIIRQYGINGDKKKLYNLTQVQDGSIAEMLGQRIEIKAYVLYGSTNSNGEPIQIFRAETDEGKIIGTVSPAFIRGLLDYLDCMESDELTEFEVVSRTSKQGRKYIVFKA